MLNYKDLMPNFSKSKAIRETTVPPIERASDNTSLVREMGRLKKKRRRPKRDVDSGVDSMG